MADCFVVFLYVSCSEHVCTFFSLCPCIFVTVFPVAFFSLTYKDFFGKELTREGKFELTV